MARRFKQQKMRIPAMILATVLFLICSTVGGVFAYLLSQPDSITNKFLPAKVTCSVEENFQNGIKSNVKIRNTGNVDAYIRVTVVATFRDQNGNVLATAPKEGTDYTVTWASSGWKQGSDGYWYYAKQVSPNELTANLIETASLRSAPDGYSLNLQIVASAIQSDPASAVTEAWGITPINGEILPN